MKIEETSTVELINEMSRLDQQIDLLLLKYEKIRLELIKRFPSVEKDEEFKKKVKK